ncbi:MAG: PQQ-binding-like beta-propeller repeat protein [Planctomycetota bacterium]
MTESKRKEQRSENSAAAQDRNDQTNDASFAIADQEKCSPWLLFALPVALGFLLALVVTIVNVIRSIDAQAFYLGLDGLRVWILGLGVALLLIAGFAMYFRPRFKTLLVACSFVFALGFLSYRLVRIESFYGNMVPRLTWSWTPTAEQRVEEYLVSRNVDKAQHEVQPIEESFFASTENDFPCFLGTEGDGSLPHVHLSSDWHSRSPELLWRHPIGLGWASFAIVGQAAVTMEQRGESECVVCYDALTGDELWVHHDTRRFEDEHGDGPRTTPAISDGLVYSLGADGLLLCLRLADGQLLWQAETLQNREEDNLLWGMSGSPLVAKGRVFVTPGGKGQSAMCFDASSGALRWKSGDDRGAYSSPMLVNLEGQEQLLSFNGAGLRAFDAQSGEPLWLVPWLTQGEMQRVNVAQPIQLENAKDGHAAEFLLSSGYGRGTARIALAKEDGQWSTQTLWHSIRLRSKMSNFIVFKDHVYGLDSGILTCINVENGKRVWKRGRYGHGQMLLAGNKLLIQAENGQVVLVAASPEGHQVLGEINALDGKTWNNLALAGDLLIVRNDNEAAAYKLPLE